MNNLVKKIVAIATVLTMVAGPAMGATVEELLAQIVDLQAQLVALQAQLSALQGTPTVTGCTISSFDRNLSQGMSGDDVNCLQIVLNSDTDTQLAASGVGSPGNETSYFGPLTKAAVIKFQEKYASEVLASWGLTSGTGFAGSTTRAKLNEILGTGVVPGPVIPGTGLSVSLASDNPAAATIVADTTSGDGAQSMVSMLKLVFANGDASDVTVTQLSVKRGGISADSDVSQAYLTGSNIIADYNSFSDGVLTFLNSAGLFTIPAKSSKTIALKIDLANGASSGKTIRFSLVASTNVVSNASAVNGTFPLDGNNMSTATAGDLGKLTVANSTDPAAAIDPQDNLDVFNFTLAGSDQVVEIRKLKLTNIGSTAYTDLVNFKLLDGATQVGDVIASMAVDKTVTFDLSGSPLSIPKGVTKNMHLKADIAGGTNRTFRFSIQSMADVVVYDTQYGVYLKPNQTDSWTIIQAGAASTINSGKLTLARASDSASGNVANSGTNVDVAKFTLKASGEDVKITAMVIDVYGTISTNGLDQGKIIVEGAQKGLTTDLASAATAGPASTTFNFGNTFIIPAGQTYTLIIRADIKTSAGAAHTAGNAFIAKIASFTATGRSSMATVASSAATGHQLTIAAGTLSYALNQAVADGSAGGPTGVPGANDVRVGSFVLTAGSGEGADVTVVKVSDTSATVNLQNLRVYQGTITSGTQIGSTQASVSTNTEYAFYPSPYISLSANQQVVLNVYADVLTGASTGATGEVNMTEVDGVGKTTNISVIYTTDVAGQQIYFASSAALAIALGDDTPISAQVVAGTSDVSFTQVKFTPGLGEGLDVTQMTLTATLGADAPTTTLANLSLWDGTTQVGPTVTSLTSGGTAVFNLSASPWYLAPAVEKNLMVKSNVNLWPSATSSGSVYMSFATGSIVYQGSVSGDVASNTGILNGNAMYTYRTVLTAAKNASSPSGISFPSVSQGVLIVDVTNNGGYTGYLNGVTTTIAYTQGTGYATTQAARYFYLYDSTDLVTKLATGTIAINTAINTAQVTFVLSTAKPVPAGTTKIFVISGDTSDCGVTAGSNAGSRIQFYIPDGTDFNWDDAKSTAVQTTLNKIFPLYGGVLTY